jgi:hypothetical protein
MKQRIPLLLILAVTICYAFVLQSCKDDPASPDGSNEIWPLAVGNYWAYTYIFNDTTTVYDTVTVVGDTIINGDKWYMLGSGLVDEIVLFRNLSTGLVTKEDDWDSTAYQYIMKYPTQVGDTLFRWDVDNPEDRDTVITISVNTPVTVAAGSFSAIVFQVIDYEELLNYTSKEVTYFSRNVGMIKNEIYRKDTLTGEFYLVTKTELTGYSLK